MNLDSILIKPPSNQLKVSRRNSILYKAVIPFFWIIIWVFFILIALQNDNYLLIIFFFVFVVLFLIRVFPWLKISEEVYIDYEKKVFSIKKYLQDYSFEEPFSDLIFVGYAGLDVIKLGFKNKKSIYFLSANKRNTKIFQSMVEYLEKIILENKKNN
jgi:hypothetical protein